MNEKNLLKRIRQIEDHMNELEKAEIDDTTRDELIKRNKVLRRYYQLKLKDLKWDLLLKLGANKSPSEN